MKKRPKKCCHPNCLECPYDDCYYDTVEIHDIQEQDNLDAQNIRWRDIVEPEVLQRKLAVKKYNNSSKGKTSREKYEKTEKGKSTQKKYNQSEKGKLSRKRYLKTEKGIENERKKSERKIESGKNASYCKTYYYRHREEILAKKAEKRKLMEAGQGSREGTRK